MASRKLYMLSQVAAHRVRSVVDRRSKAKLGVTAAQLGMLFVVRARPGCTQRDVARALKLRESAVPAAVARMVEAGLLDRSRSDGRSYALRVTARGEQATGQAMPLVAELERTLGEGFTEAELDVVERFLRAAIHHFDDEAP